MRHKSLAVERPALAVQWHPSKNLPLTPREVTAGSLKLVWWKCPTDREHVWRASVLRRAGDGSGCPFCANRRASSKNSLAVLSRKVAREWHPTKNGTVRPTDVVPGSGKVAWWRCRFGHEWRTAVQHRTKNGTGCPSCSGRRVTRERSLAVVAPAVARTWHPTKNGKLRATEVAAGSDKKAWWLCKRGHEWRATINNRACHGTGCPMCAGRKVSPERSLAAVAPELAKTWHGTRNGRLRPEDVMPHGRQKVWWQCPRSPDHEWEAKIYERQAYPHCPFCTNHRVSRTNSLATVAKKVAREWHPTKNGRLKPSDVVYGSNKKVWWLCKYGHEWMAAVSQRTRLGTGCPGCLFDDQLQRRRDTTKLGPVDRVLLAIKDAISRRSVKPVRAR